MHRRRDQCLVCGTELMPLDGVVGIQAHPEVIGCTARHTDSFGVPFDYVEPDTQDPDVPRDDSNDDGEIAFQLFPPVDEVLIELFDAQGLPRLGGASSGRGWTSFYTYQRCPYLWKRRYVEHHTRSFLNVEHPAIAIGALIHTFLALHYSKTMIGGSPYTEVDLHELHDKLKGRANPAFVAEAWRVFEAYKMYYAMETILPLAIEHDLRDPRTGESCRYDMIAYHDEGWAQHLSGTYIYEHKSAQRFDHDTIDGWANDGEILGEVALWKRLGLDHRFGELKGVVVNLVGKQPVNPKFHRTVVAPTALLLDQHLRDLKQWEGLIQLSRGTGVFPRARANCINRWGRCDNWDHCAMFED